MAQVLFVTKGTNAIEVFDNVITQWEPPDGMVNMDIEHYRQHKESPPDVASIKVDTTTKAISTTTTLTAALTEGKL